MANPPIRKLHGPPKTSWWLRNIWSLRFIFRPLETLAARTQAYGDDYQISPPDAKSPLVYFSSPEALEDIFTAQPEKLTAGRGNQILKVLLGEHSIVLLEGKAHQRQRQLLMPPFHGDRRCIGSAFALFEMKLVLFQLLSSWDLALVNPKAIRPIRRGLTVAPSDHLQLQVIGIRPSV